MCALATKVGLSLENHLLELDETLDLLIKNAEQLCYLSSVNIVRDEIIVLQNEQERLLRKVVKLDKLYKKSATEKPKSNKLVRGIRGKLKIFEKLNKTFVENIEERKGLIKFEIGKENKAKSVMAGIRENYLCKKEKK